MLDAVLTFAAATASSTEGSGPVAELAGQFGIDWRIIVAQMINFVIVAAILYKFAFKPILATLDERQKKISDGLQYAEEMKSKLAEAERQQAETLKAAANEAKQIVAEARDQAKAYSDKQMQEAHQKAEDLVDQARASIDQEREKMLSEVRQEVARLVVATTGKVLRKDLSEDDRKAIAESASRELVGNN
ncbi:MAG: F0F1 ATP synthase subunit B [Opitutales bacterium]